MPQSRKVSMIQRILLLAGLLLCGLQQVRADAAVMVPPHVDQSAGEDVTEQAIEELTRLLRVQGFDVISAGQSGPTAEAEQQRGAFPQTYDPLYCLTPECANEYRRLFDAIFAVQLSLSGKGAHTSLSVIFTESPKAFFRGSAPIEGHDVRSAVRIAFEAARQKQLEGAGPWLSIEGTPEGATVFVDRVEYGRIPFHKRHVDPGEHRIEIRAEGRTTQIRKISVPSKIDHVEQLDVHLVHGTGEAVAIGDDSDNNKRSKGVRTVWDWALGGAVLAVGAAHLAAGIYQKSKAGDCAEEFAGRCTSVYGDESGISRENLLLGFGAAGVALGATIMVVGPVGRLQVRSGVDHASLHFTGIF
jgi:hypothetical protein